MIKVLAVEPRSKKRSGDEAFGISRGFAARGGSAAKSHSPSTQYRQLRRLMTIPSSRSLIFEVKSTGSELAFGRLRTSSGIFGNDRVVFKNPSTPRIKISRLYLRKSWQVYIPSIYVFQIGGFHAISGDTNINGEMNKCWWTNKAS